MATPLSAAGRRWAIATPHWPASEVGAAAFRAGGNALDAALAAATALAVTYPHNCSAGGDLFALVRRPDGEVVAINASGAAPAALTVDSVGSHAAMPQRGPMTVTVPGVVDGWRALAELGARLGLQAAIAPAIGLADEGVPVARSLAAAIVDNREMLLADPACAALFLPDGHPLLEGHLLRQPALARTLAAVGEQGASAVYGGEVGRTWVASLNTAGSPMTVRDLAGHRTEVCSPLRGGFRDLDVLVAPPNSQGFVLLEILAAVELLGLDPDPTGRDAAVLAEVFRRASADRDRYLADPRRAAVPVDELLAARNIARLVEDVRGRAGWDETRLPSSGDTIALVAADADGWAVSLIQSLYDGFGSGIMDPETGVIFHSRGACFSLDPESPNVIDGGKRPLHTLMPVLALRNRHLAAVAGTMGGGAQPQINAMSVLRVFGLGMSVLDALHAPRWVIGGMGVDAASLTVEAEARVPRGLLDAFEDSGFDVAVLDEWSEAVGHAHLIAVGNDGFEAATDPRADGSALAG